MDVDLDHPAISGYLERLDRAASGLPQWRREELAAEIRSHLNEALLTAPDGDDAAVYGAVDRLGDPADIVAAETGSDAPPPYGAPSAGPPGYGGPGHGAPGWQPGPPQSGLGAGWGAVELVAVIGLALGVLTGGLGLVVGIICTWVSDRWTTREKVVATVVSSLVLLVVVLPAFLLFTVRSSGSASTVEQAPVPVVSVEAPGGTP